MDLLVHRNGSVSGLREYYRGWSGLSEFEQIAEREIWMQSGWSWLNYLKAGKILAMEEVGEGQKTNWAEVRIDFAATDGSTTGAYEARIEVCGDVMSAFNSAKEMELQAVKQYRISHLVKVK